MPRGRFPDGFIVVAGAAVSPARMRAPRWCCAGVEALRNEPCTYELDIVPMQMPRGTKSAKCSGALSYDMWRTILEPRFGRTEAERMSNLSKFC